MKVLIVEDEPPIAEALTYSFTKDGYEVVTAINAEECMEQVRSEKPDIILLDVMLPSASGFEVCRMLRAQGKVPIILLTSRASESDRVLGLELGADDYVTKPFSMREVLARARSVLRRSRDVDFIEPDRIELGDIVIDSNRFEVTVRGSKVDMSRREFELLKFFAAHPGQVFSRQILLDRVWGGSAYVEERTVDVHVRWIREKVELVPSDPVYITTVRGVGYRFK